MATQHEADVHSDGQPDDWIGVSPSIMNLAEQFVKLVFDLPQVQRVMLESSDDGVTIWAVIDAPPRDRAYRYPVYEREAKMLATINYLSDDVPDFRLINVREFADGARSVLPDAVKVWESRGLLGI